MNVNRFRWARRVGIAVCLTVVAAAGRVTRGQELAQRTAWEMPNRSTVKAWLETIRHELGSAGAEAISQEPEEGDSYAADPLGEFCRHLADLDPRFREITDACQDIPTLPLTDWPVLRDETVPALARFNLRLLYGRWLATSMFLDETWEMLNDVPLDQVVDPPTLLFYRGVTLYQLGRDDESLAALSQLRSNSAELPQRFAAVSQLLEADLTATAQHRLEPVARLMDRIHIRLGHARAGSRVRSEEDEVVKKLDELIDEIEKQLQAAQSAASLAQAQGAGSPQRPASDSYRAGPGNSDGDVVPRPLSEDTDWGNLPPKERERALQQLGKNFPSYYRDVVERYFRKLAQEPATP